MEKRRLFALFMVVCYCLSLMASALPDPADETPDGADIEVYQIEADTEVTLSDEDADTEVIPPDEDADTPEAYADEPENHDNHESWTAITKEYVDTLTKFTANDIERSIVPAGNYYLADNITVPLGVSSGTVNLCLNGHSITVDGAWAVVVSNSSASLNIWDCPGGGKIACTSTEDDSCGIDNSGKLTLYSGAVEGVCDGMCNHTGKDKCIVKLYGGSVHGERYGIYNVMDGSIYLSGSPSITGGEAGIYTKLSEIQYLRRRRSGE